MSLGRRKNCRYWSDNFLIMKFHFKVKEVNSCNSFVVLEVNEQTTVNKENVFVVGTFFFDDSIDIL